MNKDILFKWDPDPEVVETPAESTDPRNEYALIGEGVIVLEFTGFIQADAYDTVYPTLSEELDTSYTIV